MQPCDVYPNSKDVEEYLFVAAAALYAYGGAAAYRADADSYGPSDLQGLDHRTFLYNWDNVLTQGVIILAAAADLPGAALPRVHYQNLLRNAAETWSQCSNNGGAGIGGYEYCR